MNKRERRAVRAVREALASVRLPASNATANLAGLRAYANEMAILRPRLDSVLLNMCREQYSGALDVAIDDVYETLGRFKQSAAEAAGGNDEA